MINPGSWIVQIWTQVSYSDFEFLLNPIGYICGFAGGLARLRMSDFFVILENLFTGGTTFAFTNIWSGVVNVITIGFELPSALTGVGWGLQLVTSPLLLFYRGFYSVFFSLEYPLFIGLPLSFALLALFFSVFKLLIRALKVGS